MGFTAPRNILAFILAICVAASGVVLLSIDGHLDGGCGSANSQNSNFVPLRCAATGVGIAAGVIGLLLGLLAIFWLILDEMEAIAALRYVIFFGMLLLSVLALVAGILNAIVAGTISNNGLESKFGAAAAFAFVLMVVAIVCAIVCWKAARK